MQDFKQEIWNFTFIYFRVEGQAEVQDGYLHVVFDLKDALGGSKLM